MFGYILFILVLFVGKFLYEQKLIDKAKNNGTSKRIFIRGKPYIILKEEDYENNCKKWYEKEDKNGR